MTFLSNIFFQQFRSQYFNLIIIDKIIHIQYSMLLDICSTSVNLFDKRIVDELSKIVRDNNITRAY